jgi:hypothetical protein
MRKSGADEEGKEVRPGFGAVVFFLSGGARGLVVIVILLLGGARGLGARGLDARLSWRQREGALRVALPTAA